MFKKEPQRFVMKIHDSNFEELEEGGVIKRDDQERCVYSDARIECEVRGDKNGAGYISFSLIMKKTPTFYYKNDVGENVFPGETDAVIFQKCYYRKDFWERPFLCNIIEGIASEEILGESSERLLWGVFFDLCVVQDGWVKEYMPKLCKSLLS